MKYVYTGVGRQSWVVILFSAVHSNGSIFAAVQYASLVVIPSWGVSVALMWDVCWLPRACFLTENSVSCLG